MSGAVKVVPSKRLRAYLATHPRGFYWVRDREWQLKSRQAGPCDEDRSEFVAFFTGTERAVWLYPGDDAQHGRPYGRPKVVGPVAEPTTPKDRRTAWELDELVAKMWALWAPGGSLTRVHAFGRLLVCPGPPGHVEAILSARGFEVGHNHVTRRRGKSVDQHFLEVLSEGGVKFMREIMAVMSPARRARK